MNRRSGLSLINALSLVIVALMVLWMGQAVLTAQASSIHVEARP